MYCAGADGNTCGRKSSGDEKQLLDLEWPSAQAAQLSKGFENEFCQQTTSEFCEWLRFNKFRDHMISTLKGTVYCVYGG